MNTFLLSAAIALLLTALAAGVMGSLVTVRRSTYVAGALSHSVMAGLGLSLFLARRFGCTCFPPLVGALAASLGAALLFAHLTRRPGARADSFLSAIWTGGIALGMLFVALTPDYQSDLMSYLFGSVLFVSPQDLLAMAVLDAMVLVSVALFFNKFLAVAFNPSLAALRGLKVGAYEYLYYALVALTVVVLTSTVGVVLAVALLTLPATAAACLTRRLAAQMVLATLFAFAAGLCGLGASWFFDVPVSAAVVLSALVICGAVRLVHR